VEYEGVISDRVGGRVKAGEASVERVVADGRGVTLQAVKAKKHTEIKTWRID
jgi:hypothetical protein